MFSERRNSGRCERPNHLLSRYTSHARAYLDAKYVASRWFCVRFLFPLAWVVNHFAKDKAMKYSWKY